MRIPSGVNDQYIYFVAVDATDLKTRETGLSGFTIYRSRNGGAATLWTTPTINETDTTNMPGVYELLLDEDMTLDAGDQSQEYCIHITHASMAPVTRVFELYRPSVTAGETITVFAGTVSAVTTVTTVNGLAAGVITAAAVATGAIDADAIAADAVTKLRSYQSGTADSGTTTTLVDAALTEADTNYWVGMTVLFTSGNIAGQARRITSFNATTDTITFYPATSQAVGTNTYEIIPAAGTVDVRQWGGANVAALISSRVDVTVGAMQNDVVTAAAVAADAIGASELAADAATEIANAVWNTSLTSATFDTDQTAGARLRALDIISGSVNDAGATTSAFITDLSSAVDNFYADMFIRFTSGALKDQTRAIYSYAQATKTITLDEPLTSAPVNGVTFDIVPTHTHTLTTVATYAADAVWDEAQASHVGAGTFGEVATEVAAILVDTGTTLDSNITAIKAKTDSLTFTVAGQVDSNIQYVNDVLVTGDGQPGTEWGP